jgi:hypothetical protein
MSPVQRRFLALSIFALSFIFYYEARGARLLGSAAEELDGVSRYAHFWPSFAMGTFVLVLGAILLVVLRRPGQKRRWTALELLAYALGLGILLGTAYVSWLSCRM